MLEDVRNFLLVVDRQTFTAAARGAHVTQPALSISIRRVEEFFGARLFDRGRRGAELTAAGRALVPRARAVIAALEDGRRAVAEVLGLEAGEVRIAAGATAATYLLPPVLARFRKRYPGVRIVLRELSRDAAEEALQSGEIDLCVASGPDGEPWRKDSFILVGAPGSRFKGSPFLIFPRGTVTREVFDKLFSNAVVVMELSSIAAIKGHVAEGIGIALISRAAVSRDLASRRLKELRYLSTPVERNLVLRHRGTELLSPAAAALRQALLDSADA